MLGDFPHNNGVSGDKSYVNSTHLLALSARSPDALQALADSYKDFLSAGPEHLAA